MRKKKSSKMKKRKKTPIIFLCNPQEQTFTLKHTILSLVMSHVTRISYVICHMSILPYVTFMCLYVIRMSLICTRMSFVCHSYVLVCHPHVTLMSSVCHSYVLVCTLKSLICTRMSSVCHSHVVLPWTQSYCLFAENLLLKYKPFRIISY